MIKKKSYFEIDKFNIFDLMGLSYMPKGSQEAMYMDMNAIIWERFIADRLGYILSVRQMDKVQKMLDEGKKLKEVLGYIGKEVPNFNELLGDFTRKQKLEFIKKHYLSMLDEYQNQFSKAKSKKAQDKVREKLELYTRAIELMAQSKWSRILELFAAEKKKEGNSNKDKSK